MQAFRASDGQWRLRTSPSEIPDRLKRILIQREDRWFYEHPGVNPVALVRAAIQNVRSGRRVSGGSTITMQIARMLEPKRRTIWAKLVEVFRALQLEIRYSKNQLLEMYLSMVPLGGNVEGLKSASLLYYQTPPERLNIARLFDLILVPRDPNGLQPDRNPRRLYEERCRQAGIWIRRGLFTSSDSVVLWSTPAGIVRTTPPLAAPHFCLRVKENVRGGGDVRGTIDPMVQKAAERLLSAHLRSWKPRGVENGAVIVVENMSREVLAYVGSECFEDVPAHGQVNAACALRSPGSTLKPFLYAMLMDAGSLTPKSRLLDVPYDAEGFAAENYDGSYSGMVSADDALRRSLNVPMVRLLKSAGTPAFVQFAVAAGLHSLQSQKQKLGLSMILGGCGVTLEELVAAYAAFPGGGVPAPLQFVVPEASPPTRAGPCFSSSAAFMVTEILSHLGRPDLPNGFESTVNLPAVAFKTGTSYGRRDAWAIGYTASHTVGVWIGNVDNKGNPDLVGGKAAAPLLVDILNSISTSREKKILPLPADVSMREICAESGHDPTIRCVHRVDDYYSVSHTQHIPCETCRDYLLSPDGSVAYCPTCLGSHPYVVRTIMTYPGELLDFWHRARVACAATPLHNPLCTAIASGDGPSIVSPSNDMIYYLASTQQKLALQAAPLTDIAAQSWYIDDRFIGRVKAGERTLVDIGDGDHRVTCVDDRGRSTHVKITVILLSHRTSGKHIVEQRG